MKKIFLKSFCARCLTLLVLALLSTNLAWGDTYKKVTTVTDGEYLIVYEASSRAFNGLDVANDYVEVTISDGAITDPNGAAIVEIKAMTGGYSLKITNGEKADKYIYGKSGSNSIQYGTTAVANEITISDGAATILSNSTSFRYNSQSGNDRFRYYKTATTGASYILPALYKKETAPAAVEAPKFSVAVGNYSEAQSVVLSCTTDGASIYYTTDGTEPTAESTPYTSAIAVNKSMTIKAIAIKGEEKSTVATAAYKITTYASLEDLVADGDPGETGYPVTVTLTNEVITDFYTSSSDSKHHGVYLKVGEKTIEIYCNANAVPEEWIEGGTISGTLNCDWKNFKGTWELCPANWTALTYTAPTTYNITIADIMYGEVEANMEEAAEGVEVTLSVTPGEGYKFGEWNVYKTGEQTTKVTVTDNKFTMPAYDVTVSATFEAIPTHIVQFYVNGEPVDEESVYEGDEIVFPEDPEDIGTKKFVGWTIDPMDEICDDAPVLVKSVTMAGEDLNFYAVFATKQEGDGTYKKVTSALSDWRGDYLIAYSSEIFANGKKGGTDTDCLGKQSNNVKPENNLSEDGNIVSATWGNEYYVTLEKIDDSNTYLLKTQDGKYNYQSSNANGLSATENKSTAAKYPISVNFVSANEINLALGGDATGAVFRYNTQGYFRFYKNGGQEKIYLYKKQGDTYSGYCTDVSYTRTVTSGNFGTICLPYGGVIEGAALYSVAGVDNVDEPSVLYLEPVEGNTAVAGMPYIFKATSTTLSVDYTGEQVAEAGIANGLVGSYTKETIAAGAKNYILNNNQWKYVPAGNTNYVGANKAYLDLSQVSASSKSEVDIPFDSEPTGIEAVSLKPGFIEGMEIYNLNGVRVNENYKGIIIVNGKKYINK